MTLLLSERSSRQTTSAAASAGRTRPSPIRATESAIAGWSLVASGLARDEPTNEAPLCPPVRRLDAQLRKRFNTYGDHRARRAGRRDLVDEEGQGLGYCRCCFKGRWRPLNQALHMTRSAPHNINRTDPQDSKPLTGSDLRVRVRGLSLIDAAPPRGGRVALGLVRRSDARLSCSGRRGLLLSLVVRARVAFLSKSNRGHGAPG